MSIYTPPQLAQLFDVNPSTIKRWVDKGYLQATVTPGGHRRVTTNHINDFIRSYPKYAHRSYKISQWIEKQTTNTGLEWESYYELLYDGEYISALQMVERAYTSGHQPIQICEEMLIPALQHIGQLWANHSISVYDEHRMTFLIRRHVDHLLNLSTTHIDKKKIAILACVPREQHELPLLMAHIVLAQHGWHVINLGINVPANELITAIQKEKPQLVCVSKQYQNHEALSYTKKIYEALPVGSKLVTGGHWKKNEITYAKRMKKIRHMGSLSEFNNYVAAYGNG